MNVKDLEPGKHVLKRTGNSDTRSPLYTGQIRLEDGTTLNAAGWERTGKESGEVYVGGYVTPMDQNPNPMHRPEEGEDKTSFALFTNDKQGNDKRPDMRGNVEFPAGTKHYLSSWSTQTAAGYFMTGTTQSQASVDGTQSQDPADQEPAAA